MRIVSVAVSLFFVLLAILLFELMFERHNRASSFLQITSQGASITKSESETINNRVSKNSASTVKLVERDIESILGDILHSLPAEVLKVVLRGEKAKLTQKNQASSATDLKPSNHTKRSGH